VARQIKIWVWNGIVLAMGLQGNDFNVPIMRFDVLVLVMAAETECDTSIQTLASDNDIAAGQAIP
jgi:hypothetical protein